MKVNNYEDDNYLEELEEKEYKSRYKYRTKKIKESFSLQDLLTEKQIKKLMEQGGYDEYI